MNWKNKKILVTGGNGFLGQNVVRLLKQAGATDIVIPRSCECDLRIQENCAKIVQNIDLIFHLAAKVGGIGLNRDRPGELFYDNLVMGLHLMEEARKVGVEKFVTVGTICSYPKYTKVPFEEEDIWNGYPEETNAPYGLAKKMLLVQSQAYRQQYGFNSIVLFPTNLYGPNDNFDLYSSHVIPALIKKIYEAKSKNQQQIVLWGDGSPSRDFLYVEDAARGLILAAEKYDKSDPVNLGNGIEISIAELAHLIMKLIGYKVKIIWDKSKPNGQPRRCVNIKKAETEFGFKPQVSFEEGLARTIQWYEQETNKRYINS